MIPAEYRPLVNKILERTGQGKIKWETTSDEKKFTARIGLNMIVIHSFYAYPDEEECILFSIRNFQGESVDYFSITIHDIDYTAINELYCAARRQALNIDKIISDMMAKLE